MKTIFYRVIASASGRDLTSHVSSFSYESDIEKDDLLTVKFFINDIEDVIDDPAIVSGEFISFQYGYREGQISNVHIAKISEVEPNFGKVITLDLKCLDKGQDMKRTISGAIWKNKSTTEIAREIANKHNLNFVGKDTVDKWTSVVQGVRYDFDFLQYLASREGGIRFYISGNNLVFEDDTFDKAPSHTYTYGKDIINFKCSFKTIRKKASDGTAPTVDAKLNELVDGMTDEEKKELGPHAVRNFDANGKLQGTILKKAITGDAASQRYLVDKYKDQYNKQQADKDKKIKSQLLQLQPLVTRIGITAAFPGQKTEEDQLQEMRDYDFSKEMKQTDVDETAHITLAPNFNTEGKDKSTTTNNSLINKLLKGKKVLTATLKIEGNPDIQAGQIVTILNVPKKYDGNWFVETATHDLGTKGAYITTLKMTRRGTNAPNLKDAGSHKNVNTKEDKGDGGLKQVEVRTFNRDGKYKSSFSQQNSL